MGGSSDERLGNQVEIQTRDAQAVAIGEVPRAREGIPSRDEAAVTNERERLDVEIGCRFDLARWSNRGHPAERNEAIAAAPIELHPHAELGSVVEVDLPPFVAVVGAANSAVLRGPLTVDPAAIAIDVFSDASPA